MTKDNFKNLCINKVLIFDGSTGVELIKRGMQFKSSPELAILENPQLFTQLQLEYQQAGSDIITAPTFGANKIKMAEFNYSESIEQLNYDLVRISKNICKSGKFVFGNISSTGSFVEPFGNLAFEDAVEVFKEQVRGFVSAGADGILIETLMDLQEARAALIAVREQSFLPVIVSMTFEKDGHTLSGTDAISALITLQSLGADAVGCNCSTGPADMLNIIKTMAPYAEVPLFAQPNAGLPKLVAGKTYFEMGAEQFASYAESFYNEGVAIMGGCCGTTPEHIISLAKFFKGKKPKTLVKHNLSIITSPRSHCQLGAHSFAIIGERINPTGKKEFQAELRQGDISTVLKFAREQQNSGAAILDVNMGLSGIDEAAMMVKSISQLSKASILPLALDSTQVDVIERALRIYPGRALVNSISAEKSRIEETLPIAAKYGAMFIALPLNDQGIPKTFIERKNLVEYILDEAAAYGYRPCDVVVDGLVMTISSDQQAAQTTLALIQWCSDKGINTTCGLSNVSFGLPERDLINTAFLTMAAQYGLTSAISNPSSEKIRAAALTIQVARNHNE